MFEGITGKFKKPNVMTELKAHDYLKNMTVMAQTNLALLGTMHEMQEENDRMAAELDAYRRELARLQAGGMRK
jgi:ABC-type uncharacterized transport system ATPase subunit